MANRKLAEARFQVTHVQGTLVKKGVKRRSAVLIAVEPDGTLGAEIPLGVLPAQSLQTLLEHFELETEFVVKLEGGT